MSVWGRYEALVRAPTCDRKATWSAAYTTWLALAGSAKYLVGTHLDRQEGATKTHSYRRRLGQRRPGRPDHSELHTRGSDGITRNASYLPKDQLFREFVPIAERIKAGTYKPFLLQEARWPKHHGGERVIEYPTVWDRCVGSVLLEVLEPLLDPALSVHQHGYRASRILGVEIDVPGFQGVPRGSTDIVARKLRRWVASGPTCIWEIDVVDAFPSVSRARLRAMLIEDGCPEGFARQIIRALGNRVITLDGITRPTGGVPLGSPVGPLLFDFFLRHLHDDDPAEQPSCSFADNAFGAATTEEEMFEAMSRTLRHLHDLGLEGRGVGLNLAQRASLGVQVLGEHLLEWDARGPASVGLRRVGRDTRSSLRLDPRLPPPDGLRALLCVPGEPPYLAEGWGGSWVRVRGARSSCTWSGSPTPQGGTGGLGSGIRRRLQGGHHPIANRSTLAQVGHQQPASGDGQLCGGRPAAVEVSRARPSPGLGDNADVVLFVCPTQEPPEKRALRSWWREWSRRHRHVRAADVVLPAQQPELRETPGTFGTPMQFGEPGDDHWRIVATQQLGQDIVVRLARRGRRRLHLARQLRDGHHAVAVAIPHRKGFVGQVVGYLASGRAFRRHGRPQANPTTAVADAITRCLVALRHPADLTIWTPDTHVVRAGSSRKPAIEQSLRALDATLALAPNSRIRDTHRDSALVREIVFRWARIVMQGARWRVHGESDPPPQTPVGSDVPNP